MPGFAGGTAGGPDGLACPVRWAGHALAELGGKTVRLRVQLTRGNPEPRLFALSLT